MKKKARVNDFGQLRNGIGVAALGDKTYKYPEYSDNFYKNGGLIPGSTIRPRPQQEKELQKITGVLTKPNWDVKVKMEE